MKDHGITEEYYQRLLEFQLGRCAICGNKPRSKRLAVDHNHITGSIRGLLCKNCNYRILGGVRDSVVTLQIAINYLKYPPAQTMDNEATQE
jgi:DNA-directed RNA polymerase subunit RPC12/RpoP